MCPVNPARARRRRRAAAFAVAAALTAVLPSSALAIERSATPSTFASVFSAASAGDTVLLASGNYGTFAGSMKSGEVTIKEAAGASASMAVNFRPASNITIDGLKITDGYLADSRTKNITIRNSDFDGASIVFRAESGGLVNANILLDNNVHSNRDVCSGCWDARVHISGRTSEATGITIQNSLFIGGSADGIQNGGHSTRIIGNTFRDLHQTGVDGAHTDSIQLYGSKNTLVKGNFFYNVDMGNPSGYDRTDHEIIEDNVIVAAQYPFATQLLSDNGSVVRHNTWVTRSVTGGGCDYNLSCGIVRMGNKDADPPSTATVFKDNILAQISVTGSRPSFAEEGHNLFSVSGWGGPGDQVGRPVYVGGTDPTSYDGFRLAAGSPGAGSASDGLDRGARFGDVGTNPPPPPAPVPPPPPAPVPPPPAPSAALVAAYNFDESTGTKVSDRSGMSNVGTLYGPKRTTSGKYGRALSFDGTNDYVSVPDAASLDLTTGMTLEAWVYPTAGGAVWRQALLKETAGGLAYGLYAFDDSAHPAGFLNAGSDIGAGGTSALGLSRWTHIAATFDGFTLKTWVNGTVVAQRSINAPITTSGRALKIGGNAVWGEWFKGRIDDVRVYNRALSATEMKTDMGKSV